MQLCTWSDVHVAERDSVTAITLHARPGGIHGLYGMTVIQVTEVLDMDEHQDSSAVRD